MVAEIVMMRTLLVIFLLVGGVALAAPNHPENAANLIRQARGLMAAKRFALAIPLLEEARRQQPNSAEVHRCLFYSYREIETPSLSNHAAFHASRLLTLNGHAPGAAEAQSYLSTVAATYKPRRQAYRPAGAKPRPDEF